VNMHASNPTQRTLGKGMMSGKGGMMSGKGGKGATEDPDKSGGKGKGKGSERRLGTILDLLL
jgi:hypothetical protein